MSNDIDETNYSPSEFPRLRKPWFKKPLVYVFILSAIFIGYFSFRLGLVYNSITIENKSLWKDTVGLLFNTENEQVIKEDPNPIPEPEKNRFDVLILGIRGESEKDVESAGGLLTDTILVASFDQDSKKVAMISIPRDLYIDLVMTAKNGKQVEIKGKINEIYERGLANGGGIDMAEKVISKITGVHIDKTIVFDFEAFRKIVDTLGGIDIYLAKPFKESTQWGYEFYLPAGNNHLNGEQALYYVRSRFSTSDFDRARRQQEVIIAIKNKALSLGFLTNPLKINSLLSDLKGNIRTDFQIWDINDILTLAKSFNPKQPVKNYVISTENLLYETHTTGGEYILLPKEANYAGIKNVFKNILQ
jgi:LCP family protein required for cell wall assembly